MSVTPIPPGPPGVEFRRPDPDAASVDGLPEPVPDTDTPRWRRSLGAVAAGRQIGIGTISLDPATECYFMEVAVAPDHRRRGVGTALVAAMRQLADPDLPVLGRGMRSHPLRARFLEHLGGIPLIHCPMPRLDATDRAVQDWATSQRVPTGYRLVSLDDVEDETVGAAWVSYYTWAHQPFGTVRRSAVPDTWPPLRQGSDAGMSRLCLELGSERIVAFSLVSPDAWEGRTFIICETVQSDQPNGPDLLRAVVAASLRQLSVAGKTLVEIEGHSTDPHTPALVGSLPTKDSDPMTIYRLPAPASS